ncbi:stage II sporulation protein P [Desulfohalotomaculum tongense]|uniref:stage II sporulation protein P n=1 Tax=Desulforadius tongensis TaxID=1216062 RepID=UPI001958D75B|nr:stage II sporulation protein P [Desulforadius tongensis]MBM7854637.1 stage II sporulation protein P [Desulforadius tongensis]
MKNKFRTHLAAAMLALGVVLLAMAVTDFAVTTRPVWSPSAVISSDKVNHIVGNTVEIYDEKGNLVSKMCRFVDSGDEIIKNDGRRFRISKVDGGRATAKMLGMDKDYLAWVDYFNNLKEVPVTANKLQNRPVAIYQTHTDESYVPTDGSESKPFRGGILNVGKRFAQELEKRGVKVIYSENKHDPHDNNAYMRSRRTATEQMKRNPIAIFDIHRDGIPDANYYRRQIGNKEVTQLRLVVGKQNPKMQSNKDFAKRVMAYTNQKHPKLVKEIFVGRGNYNQDLLSTAMLIEVGTHTNKREKAEDGIALLADAVPVVLGLSGAVGGPGTEVSRDAGSTGWTTLAWIIGALLVGGGAFLLMSTGSLKGAAEKLGGLGKEMTSFMAPVRKMVGSKKTSSEKELSPAKRKEEKETEDR